MSPASVDATQKRAFAHVSILGLAVNRVDIDSAVSWVEKRASAVLPPIAIFDLNAEKVCLSQSCREYRKAVLAGDLIIADGVGVTVAARLLARVPMDRLPGIDLMSTLCSMAPARGWRVFLYGGTEVANAGAAQQLERLYPGICVCGRANGYLAPNDEMVLVERIRSAQPHLLFVALGSPRQELWIADNLHRLRVPVCQAVGGAFDVIAGRVPRAPRIIRTCGLEWLWRLICEPSRLRRQLALFRFAWCVLKAWIARPEPTVPVCTDGR